MTVFAGWLSSHFCDEMRVGICVGESEGEVFVVLRRTGLLPGRASALATDTMNIGALRLRHYP